MLRLRCGDNMNGGKGVGVKADGVTVLRQQVIQVFGGLEAAVPAITDKNVILLRHATFSYFAQK